MIRGIPLGVSVPLYVYIPIYRLFCNSVRKEFLLNLAPLEVLNPCALRLSVISFIVIPFA